MATIVQQTKKRNGPKPIVDEYDSNTTYVGYAGFGASKADAVWQIKKVLRNGTVTEILWADGNDRYDNIWNNRTALTYS
jgi:hypothetical protein